jgi:hypothetical protein
MRVVGAIRATVVGARNALGAATRVTRVAADVAAWTVSRPPPGPPRESGPGMPRD